MTNHTKLHQAELTSQENATPMTDPQIQEMKSQVFAWEVQTGKDQMPHLYRMFKFDNFADALTFTNKVGDLAEAEAHHPRITLEWGRATVEWWSHTLGGLHRNDFVMAAKVNNLYERWTEITGEKDKLQKELEDTFPASDPLPVGSRIE